MALKYFTDSDRIFYSDGYRTGHHFASAGLSADNIAAGMDELYALADSFNESLLNQAGRSGIQTACKRGCYWCCCQPIFANTLEIISLIHYIRHNLSRRQAEVIFTGATARNNHVLGIPEPERMHHRSACPFLEEGACSIYPSRPMACRIYFSTQLESCRLSYSEPYNGDNYPALLAFPLRAGRMLNEGFSAAYRQHGHQISEYRIEEGIVMHMNSDYPSASV